MPRSKELDRWARVLAVSNDTDAITELTGLREKLGDMALWALRVRVTLRNCPDPELLVMAREAAQDAVDLWIALGLVQRRFEAHERGGQ